MTPINGQRLFYLTREEIWAGEDLESCQIARREKTGEPDAPNFTPFEVSEEQAHQPLENMGWDTTLAGALRNAVDQGFAMPTLFAQFGEEPRPEPEVIEARGTLLPAAPGTCPVCATTHEPFLPHNVQSLFYQMRFNGLHGRWPTLADATAHCTPEMRERWRTVAARMGQRWTEPPEGVAPISEPPEEAERKATPAGVLTTSYRG